MAQGARATSTSPVPELVDRLDMTGTVVEAVQTTGAALEGVVVGQILDKERHPEADKLWVTTVDVGGEEPLHDRVRRAELRGGRQGAGRAGRARRCPTA